MVKLYCFQKDDEIFPCPQVIYYQKKSVNEKLHIHYEIIRIVYFSNLELRYSINFKTLFFFVSVRETFRTNPKPSLYSKAFV